MPPLPRWSWGSWVSGAWLRLRRRVGPACSAYGRDWSTRRTNADRIERAIGSGCTRPSAAALRRAAGSLQVAEGGLYVNLRHGCECRSLGVLTCAVVKAALRAEHDGGDA